MKRYEEELRDASEFYQGQTEMKEMDDEEKAREVQRRRDQAKQAAVDAKESMNRYKHNNSRGFIEVYERLVSWLIFADVSGSTKRIKQSVI